MYHFYALLARMKYIGRWSLMVSHYPENVAEHSLMTAVLAHALALIGREVFQNPQADPNACAAAALFHDAPEILTGDLPTPVKYFNPGIREAYGQVERAGVEKLLGMLPEHLRGTYAPFLTEEQGDPATARYVKAADKLSAYVKCKEELRAGNQEFRDAERVTAQKLREFAMPEIDYFMEHFLPSFALTVDELQ